VLKVDILHDVGRSINPAIDIDRLKVALCRAGDVPEHFKVALWSEPNREDNVFGSKAVGEPPFMLAISVYEALRDAIGSMGDGRPVRWCMCTPTAACR
jgi:xanthine dehydrogenase large subunit